MNFALSDEQELLRDTFARFFAEHSSPARVREVMAGGGFDAELWQGLAELGAFSMRLSEASDGLGLGTLDAALVLELAGQHLAMGPLAEAIVVARLLGEVGAGGDGAATLLSDILSGKSVPTLALKDIGQHPRQWLVAGAYADAIIAVEGEDLLWVTPSANGRLVEATLASDGIGEVDFAEAQKTILASGPQAAALFSAVIEEWRLLVSAMLSGLAREAVQLAAAYACERKAFGVAIGTFQAMSHPLANFITEIEGGKYFLWKVIYDVAHAKPRAAGLIALAQWWNGHVASKAVVQSLRTFGGYGLTTEYDIYLYNLRAKSLQLIGGDPHHLLSLAGQRLYGEISVALPDVGDPTIDFDLGPEAADLAAELDAFFKDTLTDELKAHAHYSWDGHHPIVHKKLAEKNLLFPAWPKDTGGRGVSPYASHAAAQVWEEYGWSSHAKSTTQMVAAIIERFGTDELKQDVLEPILAGDAICSLGYSEPGAGSDVFAAQCRAAPDGNGWRINGTKMFTSGANIADYVLMLTRTNADATKHKGLTMFILPLKSDGVSVQPVFTFQDERTNITFYDNVFVPDSYRLGEVDGGSKTMSAGLELEHGGGFFKSQIAMLRAAEELCRDMATDNGTPLIADAAAQSVLAKVTAHCEISEIMGLRGLWAAEEGFKIPAAGPIVKMFSSEKFLEDAAELLNLTAPLSLFKRSGPAAFLNLCYRHAHGTTIYGGTSEIHRSMIAERALGLPRSR